jgi:taurine transport system permease protein
MARLIPILLVAAAWEAFARSGAVTPFMLPPLSAVIERIWNDAASGDLLLNAKLTLLYRTLPGFLIAAVAGVAAGFAIARNAFARWFLDPIVSVGFPMPKIAFLPVIVLWLGFFEASKIAMIVLDAMLIVAVVAEMAMGGYGLGAAMLTASRFSDSRGVFAGIVEIAAVGFCLVKAMAWLRRRLLVWHAEGQSAG